MFDGRDIDKDSDFKTHTLCFKKNGVQRIKFLSWKLVYWISKDRHFQKNIV